MTLPEWMTSEQTQHLWRALVILVLGLLMSRLVSRAMSSLGGRHSQHHAMVARRLSLYLMVTLTFAAALNEIGFDLSVFWGAAGVLTVAFAFASQTSASNVISGLFLLGERPFVVGDVITVGTTTGEVISIDLMAVRLRTFDNLLVRVPNETLLKMEIVNVTHFPIRRVDLKMRLPYQTDLDDARDVLLKVADQHPLVLDEPRPFLLFMGFGEFALDVQFSLWAIRENVIEVRNTVPELIKDAFDEAGIDVPYPRSVVTYRQDASPPRPEQQR